MKHNPATANSDTMHHLHAIAMMHAINRTLLNRPCRHIRVVSSNGQQASRTHLDGQALQDLNPGDN